MTSRDLMHGLIEIWGVDHGKGDRGYVGAPVARHSDPLPSHSAADSMKSHASVQRQQILDCAQREARPLTADGFDVSLNFRPSTSGRRLPELCSFRSDFVMVYLDGGPDPKDPSVRVPKVEGITRSGRKANAYILRSLLSTLKE